jgi:hypothetical protein
MVVQERYMGVVAENGGIPPITTTDWGDKVMTREMRSPAPTTWSSVRTAIC